MTADVSTADDSPAGRRRVLVLATYGFSIRYLVPTGVLDLLADHVQPVVGLGWDDPELTALLHAGGHETLRIPDADLDHRFRMHRRQMDGIHRRRLRSPTTALQRRRRTRWAGSARTDLISTTRGLRDAVAVRLPGAVRRIESREPAMVTSGTNVDRFRRMLVDRRIDAVVSLTPYHDQDGLTLWAARDLGLPTLTSVISFDNPTTRGRMPVPGDRVLVWNRFNEDEILRSYPDLHPDQVGVIGAPQFDLHRRPELVIDDEGWRSLLGLPPERPIVLYGAGPSELVSGEDRLVRLLDEAITNRRITNHPLLLVRRHPNDPSEPWRRLAHDLRSSVVVDPWAAGSNAFRSWPTHDDVVMQMSTLAHSAVHVNVCSTMTLDGAMFDRPQIGPTFIPGADRATRSRIADFPRQEHWWPVARSGGLVTAGDEQALIDAVNHALANPARGHEGRRRMISDVLTYDDGLSSERLASEVATLVGGSQLSRR